jgi:hypothetical protein
MKIEKEYENMPRKSKNLEEEDENINVDNYIDPDDLDYCEYGDIVDTIEENGWAPITSAGLNPITHLDNDIIRIRQTKRNTNDIVLEIVCSPENIIAICGFNQEDIDQDEFINSPNLHARPHFFTLRLTDDNNNEIPYSTIIGISRMSKDESTTKLYEEFYGDLCPVIDGKLKKKGERYYFAETIILQGGERLVFRPYWPPIDITKVEVLMMTDMFVKEEE